MQPDTKELEHAIEAGIQDMARSAIDALFVVMAYNPKVAAQVFWEMDSGQMAEFFHELHTVSGSQHKLMMQMLHTRDDCAKRSPEALECFQTMFASAFEYMSE